MAKEKNVRNNEGFCGQSGYKYETVPAIIKRKMAGRTDFILRDYVRNAKKVTMIITPDGNLLTMGW